MPCLPPSGLQLLPELERLQRAVVVLQGGQRGRLPEDAAERLVLSAKADPCEAVPLHKVYGRRGGAGLYPHHTRVHLRRWPEVVLAHLEEVVDACQKLCIDSEARVKAVSWLRHEAHGKLVLVHDDGGAEGGPVGKQLEGQRRGDLVGDVGHAKVEIRQVHLEDIALDYLQLSRKRGALHSPLQLHHHSVVELDCHHLFGLLQQLHRQVSSARPDLQHGVCGLDTGLLHDGLHHQRVLQDVLPLALVKLDACDAGDRFAGSLLLNPPGSTEAAHGDQWLRQRSSGKPGLLAGGTEQWV
mmetsp:Transcript_4195/g.11829  ORF Transcript_4195/g.11829 Transcript_4195/m.11829 type:complete len:298 (+) Transcript_4195:685-1578(+)